MLDEARVWEALAAKWAQFAQTQQELTEGQAFLAQGLARLLTLSLAAVNRELADVAHPGARPTHDLDIFAGLVVPFAHRWRNHQEAPTWARETLEGTTTFAVDGSQIAPSKDISLPIGLMQIAWFENPHSSNGRYVKNTVVEILAGDELRLLEPINPGFADELINRRRFLGELDALARYMESQADAPPPKPICLYDGSLIVSFIRHLHPANQRQYIEAVERLAAVSERTRIPVAAFVDGSLVRDLVTLLQRFSGLTRSPLSDAAFLRPRMTWGERSQVFICARDDGVEQDYYERFCFAYLKTTTDNPPARIEFPRWVYDAGEHERLLDAIRAECVVGLGYPYAIETADDAAVFAQEDRERFYALLQRFAAQNDTELRFSRKATSKRQRR